MRLFSGERNLGDYQKQNAIHEPRIKVGYFECSARKTKISSG